MKDLKFSVPAERLFVRPAGEADADNIARWIRQGSNEGAFRQDLIHVGSEDFRKHRKRQRREGWNYRCIVLEFQSTAAGYLDLRYRRNHGEILGVYVEQPYRGRRVGVHALRWAVACLRDAGCRRVVADVYTSNAVSLAALKSVGFLHETSDNREEAGRGIYRLQRQTPPFERLFPVDKGFQSVAGENVYLEHLAIADALTKRFAGLDGIAAVLGMGSLGRRFGDSWSDIDICALGETRAIQSLWRGERQIGGFSVDLFPIDLGRSPLTAWDASRRQAVSEAIVLYRQPAFDLSVLRRAVSLGRGEQVLRLEELLLQLGWLGFMPRAWYGKVRFGYYWELPHDLWIRRGDVASAHGVVDRSLDLVFQLLFLVNGRLPPDPKWRRFLVSRLLWLPTQFNSTVSNIELGARDSAGFERRSGELFTLLERTVSRIVRLQLLPKNLYSDYLRTIPEY